MKKLLSFFLAAAMLCLLFAGCNNEPSNTPIATDPTDPPVMVPVAEVKYHQPATDFSGGSGTPEDPYQISNAEQLALLNKKLVEEYENLDSSSGYSTANYILTDDIALNDTADFANWAETAPEFGWEPIGRTASIYRFAGVFDGNGHTVSGMYVQANAYEVSDANSKYYGLFGAVSGTIKNLNLTHCYVCVSGDGNTAVGLTAGELVLKAAVENCNADGVVMIYGAKAVGGIVGNNVGEATMIKDSTFSGSVTLADSDFGNAGGIAGNDGQIINCVNEGTVTGEHYVGGIAGWASRIEGCTNRGAINGVTAGGIAGNLYEAAMGIERDISECYIRSCTNEGTVTGTNTAGIIADAGNDEVDIAVDITDCVNNGTLSGSEVCGGIIGILTVERLSTFKIENCTNHAALSGQQEVGGIISRICGGILHQEGDVIISGCKNLGNLTSEGMYCGGVIAYYATFGEKTDMCLTVTGCENSGSVTSECFAGGILCYSTSLISNAGAVQISDTSIIEFNGCVNSGAVTGKSTNAYAGGIAGNISAEGIRVVIKSCTNSGNIKLDKPLTEAEIEETLKSDTYMKLTQMVGGIVGYMGEGALLTTGNDEVNSAYVNTSGAWITLEKCVNTGELSANDYGQYKMTNANAEGLQVWVSYIGSLVGNSCGESAYSCNVVDCTYTSANRGMGNPDLPDVGTKG